MEILLDPTTDTLAMTQWQIQTLAWAYVARFPKAPPNRAGGAANIAQMAIIAAVQDSRDWPPDSLDEFMAAVIHMVVQCAASIMTDQARISGVCTLCGCTMMSACHVGNPPVPCSWHDQVATICSGCEALSIRAILHARVVLVTDRNYGLNFPRSCRPEVPA